MEQSHDPARREEPPGCVFRVHARLERVTPRVEVRLGEGKPFAGCDAQQLLERMAHGALTSIIESPVSEK